MQGAATGETAEMTYEVTPERKAIIDTLAHAKELLHNRAEAHKAARSEQRTHRALNRAQLVQCLMDSLALDWQEDDREALRQRNTG